MKKKLIPLIGLTLSLAVAGIMMGFTLSDGSGAPAQDPAGQIEEPSGNRGPIRSDEGIDSNQPVDTSGWKVATGIDDIDPNVCNLMHNRAPCTAEELGELGNGPMHGDPTYDEWLSDFGGGKVVTSIDDIDPNVCNLIHNRAPCTAEELGELGMTPTTGSITVGEYHPGGEVDGPGGALEGKPGQLFGEAVQTESQSDSGSSGFVYYFSADGELVSVVVPVFADGGESEIKEQIPVMMPQVPALLVQ